LDSILNLYEKLKERQERDRLRDLKDYYSLHEMPLYVVTRNGIVEQWLYRKNKTPDSFSYRVGHKAKQKVYKVKHGKDGFFVLDDAIEAYKTMMMKEVNRLRKIADGIEKHILNQAAYDAIQYSGIPTYTKGTTYYGNWLVEQKKKKRVRLELEKDIKNGLITKEEAIRMQEESLSVIIEEPSLSTVP